MSKKNKIYGENGDIVIEAILSLSVFLFAIFTLLSFVRIFYIQGRMGTALNSAAKEISQYSYVYYKFGLNELNQGISQGTEDSKELAKNTIDCFDGFMGAMSDTKNNMSTKNMDEMIESIEKGTENVTELYNLYAEPLSEDPLGLIMGMGKLAVSDMAEEGKSVLGKVLATAFMEKNLKESEKTDPDLFLKAYGIKDGMAGLDFNYTVLMPEGNSNLVQLVVTYDVQLVKLLDIDFSFKIRQCIKAAAWGNGISLMSPDKSTVTKVNAWSEDPKLRGKYIVDKEKSNYEYTSNIWFDGYDSKSNKFTTIISIDTSLPTYSASSKIKGRLNSAYSDMEKSVSELGENIKVKNKSGQEVIVQSNTDTRKYEIVLVIPDNSDMSIVNKAVGDFKAANQGVNVIINKKYGSPPVREESNSNE